MTPGRRWGLVRGTLRLAPYASSWPPGVQTRHMGTDKSVEGAEPPAVFISYSWATDAHVDWVANLARRLRSNGVDVHLDQWDVRFGHDLNLFMERYGDPSARVLVVLSDDYAQKADRRGELSSGVGTETSIVSASVYDDLGSNRVVPVIPDSGTVVGRPIAPTYLRGRKWIDFRNDYENEYERLLRELHGIPVEAAPALGVNPFVGSTEAQARAKIRNDPARWRDGRVRGRVEVNLSENSGRFTLGTDEALFNLNLEYPYGRRAHPGGPKIVRHYSDQIGKIGLIASAAERPELFTDLASIPMSNRIEETNPGDAIVMVNEAGYWALLIVDELLFRPAMNGHEPVAVVRFVIATDRSADISLEDLPPVSVSGHGTVGPA